MSNETQQQPPTERLGAFTPAAFQRIRYWPLRDQPCQPHEGEVAHVEAGTERCLRLGCDLAWVTGKSGFVRGDHLELLHDPNSDGGAE